MRTRVLRLPTRLVSESLTECFVACGMTSSRLVLVLRPVPSLFIATKQNSVLQLNPDDPHSTTSRVATEAVTSVAFIAREHKMFALNRKGELLSIDQMTNDTQTVS